MAGIFISYRREDAAGDAGRLYDRLVEHFGRDRVFRDIDNIQPGGRFPRVIDEQLSRCDVLIALIGRRWLSEANAEGRPRLEDPDDFVRLEIATALRRDVTVIPALLDKAEMPRSAALPSDLRPLASCQAIEIDGADFHDDVTRLIAVLERRVRPAGGFRSLRGRLRNMPRTVVAAAVGLIALAAALTLMRDGQDVRLRSAGAELNAEQVRAMIIERGFFSARTNPGAAGVRHDYTAAVVEGVAVVIDEATGLMWEQTGSQRLVTGGWEGAAAHVRALNGRRHGGFANWRLPTLEEAMSLLSREKAGDFHIDPVFNARGAPFIWTADASSADAAWVVYFFDGHAVDEGRGSNAFVRAVRSR